MKKGNKIIAYNKIEAIVLKIGKKRISYHMNPLTLEPIKPGFKTKSVYVSYINPKTGKITKGWFDYYKCEII